VLGAASPPSAVSSLVSDVGVVVGLRLHNRANSPSILHRSETAATISVTSDHTVT
jgi:hypothetical protein